MNSHDLIQAQVHLGPQLSSHINYKDRTAKMSLLLQLEYNDDPYYLYTIK
jgi:hypothetical protein